MKNSKQFIKDDFLIEITEVHYQLYYKKMPVLSIRNKELSLNEKLEFCKQIILDCLDNKITDETKKINYIVDKYNLLED